MKKKPSGKELEDFVKTWQQVGHRGKLLLADTYGVCYDTAKHWASDSGLLGKDEPPNSMTLHELMEIQPRVNLDFVSFDIETSNLKADFSITLSACIKPFDKDPIVFRADAYESWTTDRANDKGIIRDIASELSRHAIVVTHYGSRFDVPFLRAKMAKYGLSPLPPMFAIDSYQIAKRNFQVSSRRLANLSAYFDIGEKESVDGSLWMKAAYEGNKEALDKIVAHNIQDVVILEKLACISFPYLKFIGKL